jgi:kumamolisin
METPADLEFKRSTADSSENVPPEAPVAKKAKVMASKPLSPQGLAKLYNFPPGDGAGQRIAIAEFGGGYFGDDAALYAQSFGLPVPDVETIPVNAPVLTLDEILALPPMEQDDQLNTSAEVMLDVEVIAGLAPRRKFRFISPTSTRKAGWICWTESSRRSRFVSPSVMG